MMPPRAAWVLAVAAAVALAGCSGRSAPPLDGAPAAAPDAMAIVGLVQDEAFAPVPGAAVALRGTAQATVTDAGGAFAFRGLPLAPYLVDVAAAGFANATLNAAPLANVTLSFILVPATPAVPEPVLLHFRGNLQCAFEALIISPSCDTALDAVREEMGDPPCVPVAGCAPPMPDAFQDISTFDLALSSQWATVVVDLDFAPQPGLDGLRLTVQGRNDADALTQYEVYGRFHGPEPFTVRLEPGQTYPEGLRPVPANATSLQLEVYPHGHGWHAGGVSPFLGVGTALNVQFDVYVTVFLVEPAPEGFTLRP